MLPVHLLSRSAIARRTVRLARMLVRALYSRQRQYVTVQRVGAARGAADAGLDRKIQCVSLDSAEAVEAIAAHLPAAFRDSAAQLQNRVAHGCVLTLAFRHPDAGGIEIAGYELAEGGVFSALGRRHPAPPHVVFSHWAEVLPAYRGQRVHAALFACRDAYFERRGGTLVWGVVAPRNRASRRALERAGSFVVDTVSRVSLLGGLVAWETPPARIARTLRLVAGGPGARKTSSTSTW